MSRADTLRKLRRADRIDPAVTGELPDQVPGINAMRSIGRREEGKTLRARLRRRHLDRRHGADEREGKHFPQLREAERRERIAGEHDSAGARLFREYFD